MAQSSTSTGTCVLYENSKEFIKFCATEFKWKDLSKAVVMDVGCGPALSCTKALVEQFPHMKDLIAVDKNKDALTEATSTNKNIKFFNGNIVQRDTLACFEGKMDKVLSTNTFHQIVEKELAFQNVYRLLKPGGEAAFLFCVNSYMHKFLSVFCEIPKYKAMLKSPYNIELYPEGRGRQFYTEMLEKIGFKDIRSKEDVHTIPFSSYEACKEALFSGLKDKFTIPPSFEQTFKDEALRIYANTVDKYGQLAYISVELTLLGVKPRESVN